jgi:hypothetical protein
VRGRAGALLNDKRRVASWPAYSVAVGRTAVRHMPPGSHVAGRATLTQLEQARCEGDPDGGGLRLTGTVSEVASESVANLRGHQGLAPGQIEDLGMRQAARRWEDKSGTGIKPTRV